MTALSPELELLQATLTEAARPFAEDDAHLAAVLRQLGEDVARAETERLPIFPVAHHSPASGLHMVRWLRARPPRVIFMELCEDLVARVADLRDCTLPVALQSFAGQCDGHPAEWAPLSVVAPLTEMSAEYQAIAFALSHPEVELVFVDRSSDHVYQWDGPEDPDQPEAEDDETDAARYHGGARAVRVGEGAPSFGAFSERLLLNARVSHFSEWWNIYVDEPTLFADTETYRRMFFLIGSLFRQLGSEPGHIEKNEQRERFMWTRMKTWLQTHEVAPEHGLYICGASHTASRVEEFGVDSPAMWSVPPPTATAWSHGIIPSSHAAIEWQFGAPSGALTVAEAAWKKALSTMKLEPFALSSTKSNAKKAKKPATPLAPTHSSLQQVLKEPPTLAVQDEAQLLQWCTRIVSMARGQRYLASTADAIAIYETSLLLARMRARARPSPWDFMDAAQTCLEKDRVPGRKSIRQICAKLMGGDRVGQVGYASLPPLVQDVYDRLEPVGIGATQRNVKRVLMDLDKNPELRPVSDLLWRLQALLPNTRVARPIMGERVLGKVARQESWDVLLSGPEQRAVIQLAFEGATVEQVLQRRLHELAFAEDAGPAEAIRAAEASLRLLASPRTTQLLGEHAVVLLGRCHRADDAQEVFAQVRALVHYFRGQPQGLPDWLQRLVQTGYRTYASLLPDGFADRGTHPTSVAAALGFVLTLESLALTLGCHRSQLLIALEQAGPVTVDPEKRGLLWAAELLVGRWEEDEVRAAFAKILHNALSRDAYPRYLAGLLSTLSFTPRTAALGVDLLGAAFARLSDRVLMPWLPGLVTALQPYAHDALPALLSELQRSLPKDLAALDAWQPRALYPEDGLAPSAAVAPGSEANFEPSAQGVGAARLLARSGQAPTAWAMALGLSQQTSAAGPASQAAEPSLRILNQHPEAVQAWFRILT